MRCCWHETLLIGTIAWVAAGAVCPCRAQEAPEPMAVYPDFASLLRKELSLPDVPVRPQTRTPRLQMFRMPSGFAAMPIGMLARDDSAQEPAGRDADGGPGDVHFSVGRHVPYLDMSKPGEPGELGYYHVYSQVQILDDASTHVSFTLQALTPMGLQNGGVGHGPTTVSPGLAIFHDLGEGTALHAFVGQQIVGTARLREQANTGFQYGLAVQHPVPYLEFQRDQGFFLFVQALGEYRTEGYRTDGKATVWEVIPGLQYRLNTACGVSLGLSKYHFLAATLLY